MLAQAVEIAEAAGAGWLAGLVRAELRVAGGRRRHLAPRELTAQEARVAALAAAGASTPQIARQLSVSVSTVETHLERIYAKLGVHSRHELIALTAARGGHRVPVLPAVLVQPAPLKIRGASPTLAVAGACHAGRRDRLISSNRGETRRPGDEGAGCDIKPAAGD